MFSNVIKNNKRDKQYDIESNTEMRNIITNYMNIVNNSLHIINCDLSVIYSLHLFCRCFIEHFYMKFKNFVW